MEHLAMLDGRIMLLELDPSDSVVLEHLLALREVVLLAEDETHEHEAESETDSRSESCIEELTDGYTATCCESVDNHVM